MNIGEINEFTSRRTSFLECKYWLVVDNTKGNNRNLDKSQLE